MPSGRALLRAVAGTAHADCSEPVRPEMPTADEVDELVPQEYPNVPDDLTGASVESFVREFEAPTSPNGPSNGPTSSDSSSSRGAFTGRPRRAAASG